MNSAKRRVSRNVSYSLVEEDKSRRENSVSKSLETEKPSLSNAEFIATNGFGISEMILL